MPPTGRRSNVNSVADTGNLRAMKRGKGTPLQLHNSPVVAGRPVKVPATGSSPSSSVGVLTGKGSVPLSGVLSATVYMGVCDALDKRDTANAMFRKLY